MPYAFADSLGKRMKAVAIEREKIPRARTRAHGAAEAENQSAAIAETVDQGDRRAVQSVEMGRPGRGAAQAVQAGYRGQAPYITYLFFRMVTPLAALFFTAFYIFVLGDYSFPTPVKIGICIAAAYLGMHLPWMLLKSKIQKRQLSIKRAFPDTLDLLLICVESGMSIEAAFRKVSEEVGTQSIALAEELTLTTAELSYLPDRRMAYENLAKRTDLEGVKSVCMALQQPNATAHRGPDASGDGAGKSRHAHVGSREEGRRPAAEAHRADDRVLPAGACSWSFSDPPPSRSWRCSSGYLHFRSSPRKRGPQTGLLSWIPAYTGMSGVRLRFRR